MDTRRTTPRATARWLGIAATASLATIGAPAIAQSEQQQLVDAAHATVTNFIRDPEMSWLQTHLPEAKGVLVAPTVLKAGYIFGGSGGRAVLYVRNAQTGRWDGPAFYNVGAASFGFQAGIAVSETMTLVMTDKGINSLLAPSFKLGGDASIAAGPVGAGTGADITSDFVAYSRSKGVYGGLNLEGSVVAVAEDWNKAYYGRDVTPVDIVVKANVHNPEGERLATELTRASTRQRTSSAR
jgi:lipid-binding SYLF domain-containing protein